MDITGDPIIPPLDASLTGFKTPDSAEDVRATANKLEGVFVSMMLRTMRESLGGGGFFGDAAGADTYGGMFDQMMGEELSRRGGLGIAEMVIRSVTLPAAEGTGQDASPEAHARVKENES